MADTPTTAGTPAGTGSAGAPAEAPKGAALESQVGSGRIEVTDDAPLGGEQPGTPTETPGTLPDEVHPAVREERARAQRYRQDAEQAFVYDAQGNLVGIREEFAQQIVERMGGARPSDAATRDPNAEAAARNVAVQRYAERLGLLPEQVEGMLDLVEAIVDVRVRDANAPLLQSSAESLKKSLIESGEVPPKAAPFVAKWMDNAMKLDPRAVMTPEGRETVLKQALGEYVLSEIRARRAGRGAPRPAAPRPGAPTLLRPGGGPTQGATPTADEMLVRSRLKLPTTYTQYTPREDR